MMWKTMLLQIFISILPAVAYQMWRDRPNHHPKAREILIGAVSGISMVLCMLLSHHSDFGYQFDARLIPYVVGSLYGGYWSMGALTIIYIISRLPLLDTSNQWISYGLLLFIFCPLLMMSIRPFQLAKRADKLKIGATLVTVLQLFFSTTMMINVQLSAPESLQSTELLLIGMASMSYLVVWCSILIIENMREHELLHRQFRRMSDKYRAEVQKLQQFIDETTLGVVLVDTEGRITHLNEVSLQQLPSPDKKRSVIEMKGRLFTELFDPVRDWQCISMLNKALGGERSSLELVETEGQVLVKTAFAIRDNELVGLASITGAAIIMHDITELRKLRDELGRMDRLSLVGQMAASITHEIRNPMAVIRGFVQLMKERTGEKQHEYFRIIMDELDRANMIINDFLSLAQNRMIDKAFASLNDIVTEIMPLIQADSNLRGLHVHWNPQPDLPELRLNDKEMKQLILNLARNGLEAMKDGGSLILSTRSYPGKVELRVKDTGIGITQEQMDKLFEPFFTTKSSGTGLGLPVCLSIVEKHHARIDVESRIGEGTTFIVTFSIEESLSEVAAGAGYAVSSVG
ncbi:signal transduction histidine kinase [Paenibacillus cellulosilyticus]|uniref:histidine kinase n=1 Tax=Paenibacillus cellulosilyticus TaxID=375489 RepID=A0A2V2YXF5_9BACL|nr:ATP-binding protein [Paenibacillus cellulosilyticus]PWV97293.1 signal transduction histidine kinase [Paenibacillus cellulosilyticus]QKS47503.1 histidine kinase [Paenibacillus cellulosilyticus]